MNLLRDFPFVETQCIASLRRMVSALVIEHGIIYHWSLSLVFGHSGWMNLLRDFTFVETQCIASLRRMVSALLIEHGIIDHLDHRSSLILCGCRNLLRYLL